MTIPASVVALAISAIQAAAAAFRAFSLLRNGTTPLSIASNAGSLYGLGSRSTRRRMRCRIWSKGGNGASPGTQPVAPAARRSPSPKLIDKLQGGVGTVGGGFLAGITMRANSSVGGCGWQRHPDRRGNRDHCREMLAARILTLLLLVTLRCSSTFSSMSSPGEL